MVEPGVSPAAAPVATPVPATHAPGRSVTAIAVLIVALAAVAIAVVLLATRTPAAYPAGSPESAFQAYLVAWNDGDLETTYAAFSRAVRADATLADYRMITSQYGTPPTTRVVLDSARTNGDRATLRLRIDYPGGGGLFGGGTWSQEHTVALVREDGTWRIDEPLVGVEPQPWWKY